MLILGTPTGYARYVEHGRFEAIESAKRLGVAVVAQPVATVQRAIVAGDYFCSVASSISTLYE